MVPTDAISYMADGPRSSILSNPHREWLLGDRTPSYPDKIRQRMHEKIGAAIVHDAPLLAEHLEDGEIHAGTITRAIIDEYGYQRFGDGIRDLVAALYQLGRSVETFDPEKAIARGVEYGKRGRLTAIEAKKDSNRKLTIGELNDLANADPGRLDDPENVKWAQTQLRQRFNVGQGGGFFHDRD